MTLFAAIVSLEVCISERACCWVLVFKTEASNSMGSLPPSLTGHVYFHTANRNLNNKLPLFEKANVKKYIPR